MTLSAPLLGALRCFDVAARHCNFTRAAAELHLTPSAVSQQIRQLEQNLGQALFVRKARGLALTPSGLHLQAIVAEPLLRLDQGVSELRNASSGPLLVTCSPSFAMLWLMPRLPRLHRSHPELEIKLVAEFQSVDRQGLQTSGTHCAIRYDPVDYHDLQVVDLMPEMLAPVASPRYLASHDGLNAPSQLASHTLLHDANAWDEAQPCVEWQMWLNEVWGDAVCPAAAGQQEFNLSMLALAAARNHQGIAMGRLALMAEDLQAGTLVTAHPLRLLSSARYVFLTAHEQDARVKTLLNWLTEECRQFQAELAPDASGPPSSAT